MNPAERGTAEVMTLQHPAKRGGGRRSRFDTFADRASNFTSSPFFYTLCLILIGAMVAVHLIHVPVPWLILAGDVLTSVNLLLLALLKNAEQRAEHAIQRKLDAIAAAMLEQYEGKSRQAQDELRTAIRMERET